MTRASSRGSRYRDRSRADSSGLSRRSAGTFAPGRQHVDGVEAIELTGRPGSPISETIWVNPSTYLPVRVVVNSPFGPRQTADITWLPPTAQNLAYLTVPIPAGFRPVPLPQAVWPILPQIPAGLLPGSLGGLLPAPGTGAFGSGRAPLSPAQIPWPVKRQ